MKIDLHVHTNLHSACSCVPPEAQLRAAIDHGLDAIVISDHKVILSPAERDALQAQFPTIRIFRGAELNVGGEHVLFIGGPACHIDWLSAEDARSLAQQTGALTVLAHPFLKPQLEFDLNVFTPDAVEAATMNTNNRCWDKVQALAAQYGLQLTGSSDDHDTKYTGIFHLDLEQTVEDEAALAREVRAGRYRIGAHHDSLERRFREMVPLVILAEEVLAAHGAVDDYLARGGRYADVYQRIRNGTDYLPNLRALGWQGITTQTTVSNER